MRTSETVDVAAPVTTVYEIVADLATYPSWLPLVHDAEPVADAEPGDTQPADAEPGDTGPAWWVELRATVGPFARSKRLRMVRIDAVHDELVVFERAETDGRDHARWALRAELEAIDSDRTRLTMHLAYDGSLWTGGVLERVLDDQIRAGRLGLQRLVDAESTR